MPLDTVKLAQISIYPIKSTAAIDLSNSWVDELGLSFDRRFVLTNMNGQFITARTAPKLCLIQANITPYGFMLTAPDMPALAINYQDFSTDYQQVNIWGEQVNGQASHQDHHLWFSRYLDSPCKLLYFSKQSQRINPLTKKNGAPTAFADGYPLLLISQASLDDLNQRCQDSITMQQFRPNIVVDNCLPYEEDTWSHIRIGEVEFEIKKPCSRCIFTTINPSTASKHSQQEPLTTLKNYRQVGSGDILFGQNVTPLNLGQIKLNDTVTILSKQSGPDFIASDKKRKKKPLITNNRSEKTVKPSNKKITINFESWQKRYQGNTHETLLVQSEQAGLILPSSCLAGICGRCKVKLKAGKVNQLVDTGLTAAEKQQGYILICSCTAKTDITLARS